MKIEKKHIIIAIVAAVAVYLLWKKGVFGGGKDTGGSGSAADPADSLEGVISASGMKRADAASVRSFANRVEKDMSYKASIESKAKDNGYTYYQQLALDALWIKYSGEDGWSDKTPWSVITDIQNL